MYDALARSPPHPPCHPPPRMHWPLLQVLLFDSYLPHGTPTNTTDVQRYALQYHYVENETVRPSRSWSAK